MARGVNHAGEKVAPLEDVAFLEELVDFGQLGAADAKKGGLHFHAAVERKIIGVHHDRRASVLIELGEAADMIDVRMGTDDGFDLKLVAAEQAKDTFDFIAGIDDDGLERAWITDDGAVALQHAHRKLEIDHLRVGRVGQTMGWVKMVHGESIAAESTRAKRCKGITVEGFKRNWNGEKVEQPTGKFDPTPVEWALARETIEFMEAHVEGQVVVLETALSEMHRKNGTALGNWFGCALPDDFGDWKREYGWLRETVGLIDKNYRAYLKFTGPDRVRYLNAILTNDIKGLKENQGNISLFLNPQGHIQAEMETHALADKLFCVSYAMIRERLIPALDKYIIMDDVTLEDRTAECSTLALEGPAAASVVAEVTGVDLKELEELESREVSLGEVKCRMVKRSPGQNAGAEVLSPAKDAAALWEILREAASKHSGGPAGYQALNSVRLEQGIPWFGYDFGEKQIPHEAGLEHSHISYTKGCYTGQEIVERVRSRGQVNRVRVSLWFEAEQIPLVNAPLLSEGKDVGYVTRVGFSVAHAAGIGMGYVRREKSEPGTVLQTNEGRAKVVATPIR